MNKADLYYPGTPLPNDFTGFSFNGVHTSDLNLVRVSAGSRYEEQIIPNFQDTTVKMPGADGTLYWDSFYSERTWSVEAAFEDLNETQFRRLRQVYNTKILGRLIFDELPYKYYMAKIQSAPQIKFICFGDAVSERIYKGEISFQFVSYYPYARSVHKYLKRFHTVYNESYPDRILYPNKSAWASSCGMKNSVWFDESDHSKGRWDDTKNQYVYVYNAGDVETDVAVLLPLHRCDQGQLTSLTLYDDHNGTGSSSIQIGRLNFSNFTMSSIDLQAEYEYGISLGYSTDRSAWTQEEESSVHITRLRVNSATNLAEGVIMAVNDDESPGDDDTDDRYYYYKPTGSLYNQYISSGDFFKIPVQTPCHLTVRNTTGATDDLVISRAQYDHLYY